MDASLLNVGLLARRMGESSGSGGMGMFLVLVIIGIVVFLVLRGRQDRAEALGTPVRALPSGSVQGHVFANPFPKCPACGAAGDKMHQSWDGLRKVTWSCGYCGSVAGIQELKDEELPAGARQRLGLDAPQGMVPGQPGYYPPQGGGGGLITGMILGSMLGGSGERRYRDDDGGWRGGGEGPTSNNDWGESNNSGGGGGDWGDSGGGDSGGGDSGGGDF
jgi:uncharacterized membrane protein YgcG